MSRHGHVTFFGPYPHVFGGAERVVMLLASGLADRGWSTSVILPADGVFGQRLRDHGVPVTVVPAPEPLLVFGKGATGGLSALRAAAALPGYWRDLSRVLARAGGVVHTISQRGV